MPAPHRCVGHSPYSPLTVVHPPRVAPARGGSAIGFALLYCSAVVGLLVGLALSAYWREITAVALLGAVSCACGYVIFRTDRRPYR